MSLPKKGQLKIFLGYAGSSSKMLAMLRSALSIKERGMSVVAATAMPHASDEIKQLIKKFDVLPSTMAMGKPDFDLDIILKKRPDVVLIDELAASNSPACRHKKRYQDVIELINTGISVYAAVDIANIESLHNIVASITGIATQERLPDSVFDLTDQIQLVDADPQHSADSLSNDESSATVEQQKALRELAMRWYAGRMERQLRKVQEETDSHTDEHILVCLSSSPSNAKVIRSASRMAHAFNCRFTALFVETPNFAAAAIQDKKRLQENQKLAHQLGACIETVYGEDIPYQIAEFAKLFEVTKLVLGRSILTRKHLFGKPALSEELLGYIPELDIHIIPDANIDVSYHPRKATKLDWPGIGCNIAKSIAVLTGTTLLSLMFYNLGFTDPSIIMIYLLGVLLTSAVTSQRVYSLVSSVSSVIIFNYLFIEPRFALAAYGTGYPVTFIVMFLTAYITSTFALRYKDQAGHSAKNAYRTKILFDTDQLLSKAKDKNEILQTAGGQIMKLLRRNIVIFENNNGEPINPHFYSMDEEITPPFDTETEMATMRWVLAHNHAAGANTDTMPEAQYYYLAIRVSERVYGVAGIDAKNAPLEAAEQEMLSSVLGETSLALENDKNAREKEEAAVLAKSEQLRANLLRTISHDLRTPLTSISGNASNLLQNGPSFDDTAKQQIYSDIYNDSRWLINLVENLLYATHIENGRMSLSTAPELVAEIIGEAMRHMSGRTLKHHLSSSCGDELLLVRADAKLLVQVIINLVDNAVKYTPEGSNIAVTAEKLNRSVLISVTDTGSGIPDEEKEKVFNMFYCGSNKIADNRRSLGLGLYLCKAIVEAHGGKIQVTDNHPHGSVFSFTLPLEEVSKYGQL